MARKSKELPWIKPIPGFPGFYASKAGDIFRMKRGCLYKRQPTLSGEYLTVSATDNTGEKHRRKVSRLVATAFLPHEDYQNIVCHKDNNPLNNRVDNLYWGTQGDNMQQMVREGRQRKSKIIPLYKDKVLLLRSQGFSINEIYDYLEGNISTTSINRIIKHKR